MMSGLSNFHDEIDHDVMRDQQNSGSLSKQNNRSVTDENQNANPLRKDMPLGQKPGGMNDMVSTFLGNMPRRSPEFTTGSPENKKLTNEMIDSFAGQPGLKVLEKGVDIAKPFAQKGWDYLHPEKKAEAYRSELGTGTSAENTAELSKRAQFAKQSTKDEALIPKDQLYSEQGKSNVYDVNKSNLPEGNIDKMSHMIAPGEKYGEDEAKALSKAIAQYRKTGNIDGFTEKAEDIFNIPELGDKAASKIEDALSMPTKRGSAYFGDEDVTTPYSKKGNLMTLHNEYKSDPTMNNYQDLRSAITTQMRKLKIRAKSDDVAAEKYDQMKSNLGNLDKDASSFIQTLPDKMQDLDSEFRQKYAKYAETYNKGDKETGPSLTLRRLAEGRHDLVDDNAIVKMFSKPTAADKKAILDMGPGAAKNAIYAAIQKVPPGDAEKMATTILNLKRTKGFDAIIGPEMEEWANNMLTHVARAGYIKKGLGSAAGMAAGGALFGPAGALAGAIAPHSLKAGKYLLNHFKK